MLTYALLDACAAVCFVGSALPPRRTARAIQSSAAWPNLRCDNHHRDAFAPRLPISLWVARSATTVAAQDSRWSRKYSSRLSLSLTVGGEDPRGDVNGGDATFHVRESAAAAPGDIAPLVAASAVPSVAADAGPAAPPPLAPATGDGAPATPVVRRKRGRPKGSTSKKTKGVEMMPPPPTGDLSKGTSTSSSGITRGSSTTTTAGEGPHPYGHPTNPASAQQQPQQPQSSVKSPTSPERDTQESNNQANLNPDSPAAAPAQAPGNTQPRRRRVISIARAATAAKKNASSSTTASPRSVAAAATARISKGGSSRSTATTTTTTATSSGGKTTPSSETGAGEGVGVGESAGGVAASVSNSVMPTGSALRRRSGADRDGGGRGGGGDSLAGDSRVKGEDHENRDDDHGSKGEAGRTPTRGGTPPLEGGGDEDAEGQRRLSLLERAEVDAIIAAWRRGRAGSGGGVYAADVDELDDAESAEEAELMALLEGVEGEEGLDDFDELQELEAEWTAVTAAATEERAAGPTSSGSSPRGAESKPSLLLRGRNRGIRGGGPKEDAPQWRHDHSLKERLGLTSDQVEELRLSTRSGLTTPAAMEHRLTGLGSGGPETAVGYLLGELRMRPEEVRDAVMRWPSLLVMSERCPHAVASWLQGGLGLSGDDVCKMVKRHPSIVAYSIIHNLRPKLRWLQQELGLSRPHSIRLVVRCPAIFALNLDDNMDPKVEWLRTKLRFSRAEAARVVYANPGILLNSVEGNLMPKIDWLAKALQMDEDRVFDMVRRYPMFFTLSSKHNLEPKLEWLAGQASSDIVRRVLFRQPSLLGHNAQGNLAPKVQWLQDRLGMTEEAAWKFIGKSPGFLTLSVSDTLEPKLWWMRDKLDVSLAGAAKILVTFPAFFGLSIETSLEPKLWWVRDGLGLDRPDAAAILRRCPQIFGTSLKETLEPKLPWMALRLKTTRHRVAGIVKKYPQILAYSIEGNLAPTMDFFEFDLGEVEPADLLEGLEKKPSVLAASVTKRLLPRVAKMRAAGIDPVFSRDFRAIAQLTDTQFRAWMGRLKINVASDESRSSGSGAREEENIFPSAAGLEDLVAGARKGGLSVERGVFSAPAVAGVEARGGDTLAGIEGGAGRDSVTAAGSNRLEDAVVAADAARPKSKARKKTPAIGGGAGKRSEPRTRKVPGTGINTGGQPVSLEDEVLAADAAIPKSKVRKTRPAIGGGAGKRSESQTRRVLGTGVDTDEQRFSLEDAIVDGVVVSPKSKTRKKPRAMEGGAREASEPRT